MGYFDEKSEKNGKLWVYKFDDFEVKNIQFLHFEVF